MSSVVSSDKRFLSWNIFMLHVLSDHEFDHINNDPSISYPSWAELYSDRVCLTFDELIKQAEKQQAESRELARRVLGEPNDHPTLVIPETELPMSLSPDEVYQGLLQFAPPYGLNHDPLGPQIEYRRDLEFFTHDDEWVDFSDHEMRSGTLSAFSRSPPSAFQGSLSSNANSGSSSRASPSDQRPCDEPLPAAAAAAAAPAAPAVVVTENAPEQPAPQPFSKVISRPVAPSAPVRRPSSGFASDFTSSDTSPVSCKGAASSAPAGPMLYRPHRRRRPRSATMCNFCRNNGEAPSVYTAHSTKDSNGYVSCPILYCHVCEACGATGAFAHTRSYCPMARVIRDVFNDDANMQMRYSNFAKTARDK